LSIKPTHDTGLIYLVRHCHTSNDDRGSPLLLGRETSQTLSETGKKQALRLASHFAGRDIAAVYASPMSAAVQTARAIRSDFDIPLTFATSLSDANFGDWIGMTTEQTVRTAHHPKYYADPGTNGFPNGETFKQICRRALGYIKQLAVAHAHDRIVVVSHDIVNRIALCHLCGVPFDRAREIDQTSGCINLVRIFRGQLELRSVDNDITALTEEAIEQCDTCLTILAR